MAVKEVFVRGYGVIDEARQLSMERPDWQDIRSRLNRQIPGTLAHCFGCHEPVFLRAGKPNSSMRPHFSHFKDGGIGCPWGQDTTRPLDRIRAGIFTGNQESELHRHMCERALELIEADARYVAGSGAVDSYMKSKDGYRGRWPDASFDIDGLGKFAIEVQFAPSLAPEVIGRSDFYAKEGVNLIWLLPWYSFEQVQRAYASDIAQEARGNFFVLDQEAERESRVRGTLVIWAAWIGERSFERKLVSLDDLTYPKGGHPFFVDAVTPAIFRTAERRRQQISLDLLETKDDIVPKRKVIFDLDEQPDEEGSRLIRSAISIWSAAKGEYINYSGHSDKLTGQIDAYLNSNDGRRRAVIINQMLVSTQARPCIKRSVWEKIERADLHDQLDDSDRWVAYVHSLFPEVFRVDLRSEALVAGSLPTWAIPAG